MKNLIYLLLLGYSVTLFSGCNFLNHDDDTLEPNPVVLPPVAEDFIAENYPSHFISSTDTEDLCDSTLVLEVELEDGPGPDVDLYFSLDGTFLFTETDISLIDLPEAVRNAISNNFADYSINEQNIERHDYPDGAIEYEVELIHNITGDEDDAVFNPNGELLCFEADHNDDNGNGNGTGVNIPDEVRNFIQDQYSGYIITSSEQEDICDDVPMYEVELEDGPGPDMDLYFNLDWVFQFSEIEISVNQLPAAVTDAINTNYAGYEIDEDKVEQLERPDGSLMYAVELESNDNDAEVIFHADGSIYCEDQ
ncbi:PepSY-like domain-containing protein [Lewinella cohaerens]|uniref:PepSY-like domain-containing protein n=1 Tax=Lewinella cohaerens TaxID=70995 RepID=UPI000373D20F|nr:PepSY-like domain-containing protein [Lewinella cohaerens]